MDALLNDQQSFFSRLSADPDLDVVGRDQTLDIVHSGTSGTLFLRPCVLIGPMSCVTPEPLCAPGLSRFSHDSDGFFLSLNGITLVCGGGGGVGGGGRISS